MTGIANPTWMMTALTLDDYGELQTFWAKVTNYPDKKGPPLISFS